MVGTVEQAPQEAAMVGTAPTVATLVEAAAEVQVAQDQVETAATVAKDKH